MSILESTIQNNDLASIAGKASSGVLNAIKTASTKTGVNFAYMVQQAAAESSFKPDAKAKTSSASGLYQFIESTWLSMVEKHGDKHNISTDGKTRGEILELRNDPRAASLMAAEFASENQSFLQTRTKGEVGSTELYFAHFLGAGQAAEFLNARAENPNQESALIFPKAAKANRNVFYDQTTGRAKSLQEVYAFFDKKFSIDDIQSTDIASTQPPKKSPLDSSFVKINTHRPSYNGMGGYQNLFANPLEIMMLAQMDLPGLGSDSNKKSEFSLFSVQSLYR